METQVKIENISKSFNNNGKVLPVIQSVSLEAKPGQIVAILGRSGSGKTTLLNLISQLEEPNTGKVEVSGKIGYVPQRDLLLPWRTVMHNVLLPIEIERKITPADIKNAEQLLKQEGLQQFGNSFPSEMSGGMRQKASLIRTLIQNPDIILFDEPFSAIDFDTRLRLVREVRSHIKKTNKVGVFVTHNIEEAIAIADKVILIAGKPARIVYENDVAIEDELRDPVKIRTAKDFQKNFETIWQLLSKEN